MNCSICESGIQLQRTSQAIHVAVLDQAMECVVRHGLFFAIEDRRGRCLVETDLMINRWPPSTEIGDFARFSAASISWRTLGSSSVAADSSRMLRTTLPLPRNNLVGSGSFATCPSRG